MKTILIEFHLDGILWFSRTAPLNKALDYHGFRYILRSERQNSRVLRDMYDDDFDSLLQNSLEIKLKEYRDA